MLYELRTYDLRPNSVAEAERRFAAAYERRKVISEMAASFHTEIGPLNQIVQLWAYSDLEECERSVADASLASAWPPNLTDILLRESTEVFVPFDFSPQLKPGSMGPYFEVRTYEYADGDLPKIVNAWKAALPERMQWSTLATVCACEASRRLMHIWPYRTMDERADVRAKSRATGRWPAHLVAQQLGLPTYKFVHQENKIVVPSAFSPIQ